MTRSRSTESLSNWYTGGYTASIKRRDDANWLGGATHAPEKHGENRPRVRATATRAGRPPVRFLVEGGADLRRSARWPLILRLNLTDDRPPQLFFAAHEFACLFRGQVARVGAEHMKSLLNLRIGQDRA